MVDPTTDAETFLEEAYKLTTDADRNAFYAKWAEEYDRQMLEGLGYVSPRNIAEILYALCDSKQDEVLDIGCGTGLCGDCLVERNFTKISGIDLSQNMLDVAKTRGIYDRLVAADLNETLPFPDNEFGNAICAGTFTHGHVDAGCLREIFRVIKPEGVLACTVHFELWDGAGFGPTFSTLMDELVIDEVVRRPGQYFEGSQNEGWFCCYRKRSKKQSDNVISLERRKRTQDNI
ncbi:MAG: class I SAM-dependent methyltransferase [Pseudomonadota bacterium]